MDKRGIPLLAQQVFAREACTLRLLRSSTIVHTPYDRFHSPLKCFRASRSGCSIVFFEANYLIVSRILERASVATATASLTQLSLSLSLSRRMPCIDTPRSYNS